MVYSCGGVSCTIFLDWAGSCYDARVQACLLRECQFVDDGAQKQVGKVTNVALPV